MFSNTLLAANPVIGKKLTELVNNKMCRFCLSETADLFDIVECEDKNEPANTDWKQILTTCFSISASVSKNLFKYACERCCEFVKKCYEFHKLRRKAEVMLLSYSLTGLWMQKLDVPEWLRPVRKRKVEEEVVADSPTGKRFRFDEVKDGQTKRETLNNIKERSSDSEASLVVTTHNASQESTIKLMVETTEKLTVDSLYCTERLPQARRRSLEEGVDADSPTGKKFCSDEKKVKGSQVTTEPLDKTKEKASDKNASLVGTRHIRSQDSSTVQPTLQSPMITSGNAQTTSMTQTVIPQQSGANAVPINQQSKQLLESDKSAVPISKPQPSTRPDYQNQPSSSNGQVYQLSNPITSHPILIQKFELLQPQNSVNQPSTSNSSSAGTQPTQISKTQPESPPPNKSTILYFRCLTCAYQFFDPKHLDLHMRKHAEKIEFRCSCDQKRRDWVPFLVHIEQKHRDWGLCYLCGEKLDEQSKRRLAHLKQHLEAKLTHACDFCMLSFTSAAKRIAHISQAHWSEARVVIVDDSGQV